MAAAWRAKLQGARRIARLRSFKRETAQGLPYIRSGWCPTRAWAQDPLDAGVRLIGGWSIALQIEAGT